jgi:hypothetical protein
MHWHLSGLGVDEGPLNLWANPRCRAEGLGSPRFLREKWKESCEAKFAY